MNSNVANGISTQLKELRKSGKSSKIEFGMPL